MLNRPRPTPAPGAGRARRRAGARSAGPGAAKLLVAGIFVWNRRPNVLLVIQKVVDSNPISRFAKGPHLQVFRSGLEPPTFLDWPELR
jgi:hypothetical protein